MGRFCIVCNIKIAENNYLIDTTVCESCYNKNRTKKNNNNTLIKTQQPKTDNVKNKKSNRTLIIGFSNCCEPYLLNHILHQNQEPIFIITKSLNQYLNIKAQTSDEYQPKKVKETVLLFLMMRCYRNKKAKLISFSQADVTVILIFTKYLKGIFISQKILFVIFLIYVFYLNKLEGISYYYFMI